MKHFAIASAVMLLLIASSTMTTFAQRGGTKTPTSSTTTGQSVMIQRTGNSSYTKNGDETWEWDRVTAATYYSNSVVGLVGSPTCTGSATNCASTNRPAEPTSPAPDATQLTGRNGQLDTDECAFFNGGSLGSRSYNQSLTVRGANGSGNWTFTWAYSVFPIYTTVGARTLMTLVSSSMNDTINLVGYIAALSGMSTKTVARKYSFGLENSDGTSRITNLQAQSFDSAGLLLDTYALDHFVESNAPGALAGDLGAVDFNYVPSPGQLFGTTSILTTGDARSILNGDNFHGNNNGGSDGRSLARAPFGYNGVRIADGDNTITITGNIKGNEASVDTSISASFRITRNVCNE